MEQASSSSGNTFEPNSAPDVKKSLYDQLGGEAAIQGVVDKMYEGIFNDPELTDFFRKTDKQR